VGAGAATRIDVALEAIELDALNPMAIIVMALACVALGVWTRRLRSLS